MSEPFELLIPKKGKIELIRELPDALRSFHMPLYQAGGAVCDEASMIFQQVQADGFAIWRSNYLVNRTVTINGRASTPVVELCIAFKNHFVSSWDGVGQPTLRAMQLNFCYGPFVNNKATLIGGQQYETMDFHFELEMLQPYINVYDELKVFFDKVERKEATQLSTECMLTGKMKSALADILEFECRPAIYPRILRAKVEVFLALVFEALCTTKPPKKINITPALIEKAHQAKAIILGHMRERPTVAELAKLTFTNVLSIQAAFKRVFGETIDEYEQSLRLDYVKGLLLNTKHSLEHIAHETGYADHSSLSKFFRRHVGCSPGEYRKYGKKK